MPNNRCQTVKEEAMTTSTTQGPATTTALLGIYLNDHLAGATSGMELARRMTATAATLRRVTAEIVDDRQALLAMMSALDVPVRGYKVFGAWAGEKAGRVFKFNGHLLTRSPLSQLEETEILLLGVVGKAAGWRTLRRLADRDSRLDGGRLDALLARADRQAQELEALRTAVVDSLAADGHV
jgi:hypothetical protein